MLVLLPGRRLRVLVRIMVIMKCAVVLNVLIGSIMVGRLAFRLLSLMVGLALIG